MKKADLQKALKDGTEVAVLTGWSVPADPWRAGVPSVARCRVVALGQAYLKQRGWESTMGTDGVRVSPLDGDGSIGSLERPNPVTMGYRKYTFEDTPDRVVQPRRILSTWAEFQVKKAAYLEDKEREQQASIRVRAEAAALAVRGHDAAARLRARGYESARARGGLIELAVEDVERFLGMP